MRNLKKTAALLLCLLLVFSLAACTQTDQPQSAASGGESTASTESTPQAEDTGNESALGGDEDIVTLQVFSMPSNASGMQEDKYWTDILRDDLGIVIELLPAGDQSEQKLQALMASNDLPDVVIFNQYKHVVNAIEAGLIINLDEYQDQLPNVYENALNSVQYFRDNVSAGTGNCYSVGHLVTNLSQKVGNLNFGPYLRWDYYEELGKPQITTMQDYLPVLKAMQDAHPETEDGQKVYAMSMWSDWDGLMMQQCDNYINLNGGGNYGFVEVMYEDNSMKSIFEDDSIYREALQWFFDANQMGIVDPDSMTQRWNDYVDKSTAGRTLWSWWPWGTGSFNTAEREDAGKGFRAVFFEEENMKSDGAPNYVGGTWSYAVSASSKHLDKSLAFMDYMYSYDGVWKLRNGEQGVFWDVDEEGEPFMTELGWDMWLNSKEFPNGGKVDEGLGIINSYGIHARNPHPVYGRQIDREDWLKKDFAPKDSALKVNWQEAMDAKDDLDYLTKNDLYVEPDFAPMDPVTDEIEQINARIADVVKTNSWKMVFAADQTEFDALWDDMVKKAYGMNGQDSIDWYMDAYKRALESGEKYMN